MEQVIAGGILLALAKLGLAGLVIRLAWACLEYVFDHAWILWTLVGLAGAAAYLTYTQLWGCVSDHAAAAFGFAGVVFVFAGILVCLWKAVLNVWRFAQRMSSRLPSRLPL
jgi:hypothetical protein